MQRAVALVLVVWSCALSRADAQAAPAEPAPASPPAPVPASPPAPEPSRAARARVHFQKGLSFSRAGDCSAATAEFEAAYALVPEPEALYAIAQCQDRRVVEPAGADPTLFFIGAGATVLATGLGTFFALRALSLHDEALELPAAHPERSHKREQVENAELTADVLFGSAALLAAGTAIVFFITDWDAGESAGERYPEPLGLQLAPTVTPFGAGLWLRGRL
jgi:hypothetical protein